MLLCGGCARDAQIIQADADRDEALDAFGRENGDF
jgi:hypothetical protein